MKKLTAKQLEKRDTQFRIWAYAIRIEIQPDEDGYVRAIIAIIPSFTRLSTLSEQDEFMDWCEINDYKDLVVEYKKWRA